MLEEQRCIEIVGESGNAEHAITKTRRLDPQVVILDICMPGGGGRLSSRKSRPQDPAQSYSSSPPTPIRNTARHTWLLAPIVFVTRPRMFKR